jgi:cell division protein FtsI/penicillin-binding protein 2
MAKRSRLRVHKGNRGRRVLLCIFLLGLFFTVCYSLNKKYEIIDLLQDITGRGVGPLSPSVIERGSLYDRNLKLLAVTMERVAVFVRTREVESISDTALSLASALALDRNTLIDQLESGVLRFWVAEYISEEQER